jgi:hypothetical protein
MNCLASSTQLHGNGKMVSTFREVELGDALENLWVFFIFFCKLVVIKSSLIIINISHFCMHNYHQHIIIIIIIRRFQKYCVLQSSR